MELDSQSKPHPGSGPKTPHFPSKLEVLKSENTQPAIPQIPSFVPKMSILWDKLEVKNALDIFRVLYPKKLVLGTTQQINQKMREAFANQDEKQIKKKLFKPEQIYEYFGVKLLMGYIQMKEFEDYFDENLLFQTKIPECIKEGRFKCLEQWTICSDWSLLPPSKKHPNPEVLPDSANPPVYDRISKKISKLQRLAASIQQTLIFCLHPTFPIKDHRCVLLIDAPSALIVGVHFHHIHNTFDPLRFLNPLVHRHHILLTYDDLLTPEQLLRCHTQLGIHPIMAIPTKLDNASLPTDILHVSQGLLSSTPDPAHLGMYHHYHSQPNLFSQHQLRCPISYRSVHSAVFAEMQEIAYWNSYILAQALLDSQTHHQQFRLQLAELLLRNKLPQAMQTYVQLPLQKPRLFQTPSNTELTGPYGHAPNPSYHSLFHIPTQPQIPKNHSHGPCLVCRRQAVILTQCRPCTETSHKLVLLCPCECFVIFHQNPHDFIINADDVTFVMPKSASQTAQQSNQLQNSHSYQNQGQQYMQQQQQSIYQHPQVLAAQNIDIQVKTLFE